MSLCKCGHDRGYHGDCTGPCRRNDCNCRSYRRQSASWSPWRERLRRAVEDGELLYQKRMHGPDGLSLADEHRLDGILSLDLKDALGYVDELLASLATLRSAWNAHMVTCPQHAALPTVEPPTEAELAAWRDAPSGTASASKCPHGVTLGVYCRECDYDEAMAVDADGD